MTKRYLDSNIPYPLKCFDCIYVLYDELLRYDICKIDKRPYYFEFMMKCDNYKKNDKTTIKQELIKRELIK